MNRRTIFHASTTNSVNLLPARIQTDGRASFIAVEGVDGSGKTSTAILLAGRLQGIYLKTPPKEYSTLRHHFDSAAQSSRRELILARFFFYLSSLCETADAVVSYIKKGTTVVVDRWVLSTLLYHEQLLGLDLSPYIKPLALPQPDACFVLQPSLRVIYSRLEQRSPDYDHALEKDRKFISRMYRRYASDRSSIHIQPGKAPVDEVVDRIINAYHPLSSAKEVCHA